PAAAAPDVGRANRPVSSGAEASPRPSRARSELFAPAVADGRGSPRAPRPPALSAVPGQLASPDAPSGPPLDLRRGPAGPTIAPIPRRTRGRRAEVGTRRRSFFQ